MSEPARQEQRKGARYVRPHEKREKVEIVVAGHFNLEESSGMPSVVTNRATDCGVAELKLIEINTRK